MNVVCGFIARIRQHRAYANCLMVAIIESNLNAIDTTRFAAKYFAAFPPVYIHTHKREGREHPGIFTTHENKLRYSKDLIRFLETRSICFASDLIVVTEKNTDAEKLKMIAKFHEQLRVFALIEEKPTRPGFQNVKITTTGKHRGAPDDMAMAIQMAVHFSIVTILKADFTELLMSSRNRRLIGT